MHLRRQVNVENENMDLKINKTNQKIPAAEMEVEETCLPSLPARRDMGADREKNRCWKV